MFGIIFAGALVFTIASYLSDAVADTVCNNVFYDADAGQEPDDTAHFDKAVLHCATSTVTHGITSAVLGAALRLPASVTAAGTALYAGCAGYALMRAADRAGSVDQSEVEPLHTVSTPSRSTSGGGGILTDIQLVEPTMPPKAQGPAA
ncbi:hypothetical protein ACIS_00257 [Anaplasma centrale str. Israel]|uniref:Uncharacterized protein n=1 Tax=Anaplasma centrale (strain Israel) TaxID=574556 RepID=D1ATP9_ANACI|nr:hypothetical protein [Anaplasma centrale]ACZ48927.1 hypothetical protein ACIS_00257 [Anaplasma centrale str. Israel]